MGHPSSSPTCAIVIAVHNNLPGVRSCLLALERQSRPPDHVYIADDGSASEVVEFVQAYPGPLRLSHVWQEYQGYRRSISLNNALRLVQEAYVICLDGDEVTHPRFIEDHLACASPGKVIVGTRCGLLGFRDSGLSREPSVARLLMLLGQGRVINDSMAITVTFLTRLVGLMKGVRLPFRSLVQCTVREVHGGNLATWRDDLVAINGYDEEFTGWGFEDHDLVRRLQQSGAIPHQLRFQAICFHLESAKPKSPNRANKQLFDSNRPTRNKNGIEK